MKVAFLNLCHCDPELVARAASRLTANPNFHMYVHVDAKTELEPFSLRLEGNPRVHMAQNRQKVYWGGFNAITATVEMLSQALSSEENFDYFIVFQNLDYPIRSIEYIEKFFVENNGKEFIRGCKIARTKDRHYSNKYKIYNKRDDNFYLKKHSKPRMLLRYFRLLLQSVTTVFFDGVIRLGDEDYSLYYGAAQWAVTRSLARYFVDFYDKNPGFNKVMRHIQFPDEEYFHTITHNSEHKYNCIKFDEPERRWLVNWRNLHYFEYPKTITVFTEADYQKLIDSDGLFIRKVRSDVSAKLLDLIDKNVHNVPDA